MKTFAIKGEEKILVTSENKDRLIGYTFIQEEIIYENEEQKELAQIDERLKGSKERYTELKEMGEMRSNAEEIEFQALETGKNTLLARRKQILDFIA